MTILDTFAMLAMFVLSGLMEVVDAVQQAKPVRDWPEPRHLQLEP